MSARPPLPADSSSLVQAVLQALNVQHNGAAIAAETGVDFEDSNEITWTVTDDPANQRVQLVGSSTGTFAGDVTVEGSLLVDDTGTFAGDVTVEGGLLVDDTVSLGNDLIVDSTVAVYGALQCAAGILQTTADGLRLGFFSASPTSQPTGAGNLSYSDSGAQVVHTAGRFIGIGSTGYTIGDLVIALKQLGLIEM